MEHELELELEQEKEKIFGEVTVEESRILRVYHDEAADQYYIDVFAAYAAGLISYEDACKLDDGGVKYYKISESKIVELAKELGLIIKIFPITLSKRDSNGDKHELEKELQDDEYAENIPIKNDGRPDLDDFFTDVYSTDGENKSIPIKNGEKPDLDDFFTDVYSADGGNKNNPVK